MSSLWNRSGTIERYADDLRAAGAKAYFFLGGTTTPFTVYQDAGEFAAHAHPVEADANGRWPDIFVPYVTAYDVQVKTAEDVQLTYTQNIPNPDPIDLSVTIPAEEKVQTGMIHAEFVNTTKAGYVRLNGRTIGNDASGATERANADTSALFNYLWNNLSDTIAPVSGGRGASAAADFTANKNIGLPDMRATAFIGLDDMGNSASGSFDVSFDTGDAVTPGSITGADGIIISEAQLPAHSHAGITGNENANHDHSYSLPAASLSEVQAGTGITVVGSIANNAALTGVQNQNHTHNFTSGSVGGGSFVNNLPYSRVVTWFIKL